MVFEGYSISIKGASHDDSGRPCQDSSSCGVFEDYAVAVVSDGHGGSRYYRSEVGSRFAVNAALDAVSSCMGADRADFMEGLGRDPQSILTRLTDAVLARWTDAVGEYDSNHPPTEAELSLEDPEGERDVLRAYGATLVCGVMSDDAVFGFQIGDGDLVAINDDSEESMIMPGDPDCFLNRTSSICGSNASSKFRHFIVSASVADEASEGFRAIRADARRVVSLSVCTDGLGTSFNSPDSLKRYCAAIPEALSTEDSRAALEENLRRRSCSNTRDDVSVAAVYREIRHAPEARRPSANRNRNAEWRKKKMRRVRRRCRRRRHRSWTTSRSRSVR